MGTTNFDVVQANAIVGAGITDVSPFASIFYVDGTNGNDGNSGRTPGNAVATIAQAISLTVSGRGDHIIIAAGTYLQTASLVPKAGNVFRPGTLRYRSPGVKISGNVADLVQIDVNNTKWIGIEFLATGATTDNLVDIADAADVAGAEFYYCVFNGADQTSVVGVQADDATFILTSLVMNDCLFRDLTGKCIDIGVLGFAYSEIKRCQFAIDVNSGVGIALADTSAFATGKGYVISDNLFTGFDATADEVFITIAGTEDTTGAGIITRNMIAYGAAAAVTIDKLSKSEVNNFYGDAATGGTLVDPGT